MVRFYLVPTVVLPDGRTVPKYFMYRGATAPLVLTSNYQLRSYGTALLVLVAADTTDPDDALLVAQTDVTKFADNIDQQLGADLVAMQNALELLNLPAQMLTSTTTHRQVIRGIMGVFEIAQCMQGQGFDLFSLGLTLSSTLSAMPTAARQSLQACATQYHYDQTGITLASTIRQLLTKIVQQAAPSPMMGVTV